MFEWVQGGDHPKSFRSRDKRAMSYLASGKPAKAIRLYQWTLADCQRILGAHHPDTRAVRANLAAMARDGKAASGAASP
jgi:hypothetical protein